MFLDWVASLGLLSHNADSNILKDFSLPVKKILVAQVVTFLLDEGTPVGILSSAAHVRWAMETVGQGFTLPIAEEDSIKKVIELYRRWALEPLNRPSPIEANKQAFLQDILRHYSLLFAARARDQVEVEKHATLCSKVLDIYVTIGRRVGKDLSVETWEIFLKLVLGIADSLFRNSGGLQDRLCSQTLKVMFELWLHSRTRNPQMWKSLKSLALGWTHLMPLVMQWNVTTLALTNRSLALLYGPANGTDAVILKLDDSQTLHLEDDFVYYAWHRTLHILGNLNALSDPKIFVAALNGLEILTKQYLKIAPDKAARGAPLPPDGNTILHIFGAWLFNAVRLDRPGFEEGTALAIKIMCSIFCTRFTTKFLSVYLASFYGCLQDILQKDGRVLISAILHCVDFFCFELQGCRILVPHFLHAINRVLLGKTGAFEHIAPLEKVRRACLHILSTIICLPNHFSKTRFASKALAKRSDREVAKTAANVTALDAENYSQLKPHINVIFLETLKNEAFAPNLQLLLSLIHVWMCEDIEASSEFSKSAINQVVRKVVAHNAWPVDVMQAALRVLHGSTVLYPFIKSRSDMAKHVVSQLCRYVTKQCVALSERSEQAVEKDKDKDKERKNASATQDDAGAMDDRDLERLVADSFACICAWVMVDQWILNDESCMMELVEAIVVGLTGKKSAGAAPQDAEPTPQQGKKKAKAKTEKRASGHSELIRESAEFVLLNLMNMLGNFPPASGPSRVSTLVSEEDVLVDILTKGGTEELPPSLVESKQYIRYFVMDNSMILTVIDRPYEEGGPGVSFIVRDKTGKYAWDTKLSYLPLSEQAAFAPPPMPPRLECCVESYRANVEVVDEATLGDVFGYLENRKGSKAAAMLSLTAKQVESERRFLESTKYNLNCNCTVMPPLPANPYSGESKFMHARILLSHLGYLSLENRGRLYLVDQSSNFFNNLKLLDQVPERECQKIAVLYVSIDQHTDGEIFRNFGGPIDYQEFVSGLGWGVNLQTHNGFSGGLDRKSAVCEAAPYHATHQREVFFHVATLMANSDAGDDQPHKQQHIINDYVLIIWAEDMEYSPANLMKKSTFNNVHIVINPLPSGLYRIKIYKKSNNYSFGPLTDNSIVSKAILGPLVRETACNAYRAVRLSLEGHQSQLSTRARVLKDISSKHRRENSVEQYYTTLFTPLPASQVGPPISAQTLANRPRSGFNRIAPSGGRSQNVQVGFSRNQGSIKVGSRGSPRRGSQTHLPLHDSDTEPTDDVCDSPREDDDGRKSESSSARKARDKKKVSTSPRVKHKASDPPRVGKAMGGVQASPMKEKPPTKKTSTSSKIRRDVVESGSSNAADE